jgi:putative endonuclease
MSRHYQVSSQSGQWAEDFAHAYLCQQGLQPIERNYRCRQGEIDLIMQQQTILVFIEVRYRQNSSYGGSLESIDYYKQQRILRTANHYLHTHSWAQQYPCRFDVVLIQGHLTTPQICWLTDAFRDEVFKD